MSHPFFLIDAFCDGPFTGNPAGVVLLERPEDEAWMAAFAAEVNQAETAFVVRGDREFGLRWFTPTVEVDLCGHATLASAHALATAGWVSGDAPIAFRTKSGVLRAESSANGIALDFPAEPAEPCAPDALIRAVAPEAVWFGRNRFDRILELPNDAAVRAFEPDMAAIARLGMRGLIVTARGSGGHYDFVSRFFAPQSGVPEDSLTGSAHCCLGPYWSARLGRTELVGYQASPRGGTVRVQIRGDRVGLAGGARVVVSGHLAR